MHVIILAAVCYLIYCHTKVILITLKVGKQVSEAFLVNKFIGFKIVWWGQSTITEYLWFTPSALYEMSF